MNLPQAEPMGVGWRLKWVDEDIVIEVPRLRKGARDEVKAELVVLNQREGFSPRLAHEELNLLAGRSKDALAKKLTGIIEGPNWEAIVNQCADMLLMLYKTGEPSVTLRTWDEDIGPTPMLLDPIAPAHMPTVLFGDGGTAKSLLAQMLGLIALLPWRDNPLGLEVDERSHGLLYLDWEADWKEIRRRLKCISNGMDLGVLEMEYRRCALPLEEDVSYIQDLLVRSEAEVVVIDSLGPASGGEPEKAQFAIAFYHALRSLVTSRAEPPTTFIVAHEAKNAPTKSIFGSVFFNNLARSVWQIKAQPRGPNTVEQSLHHRKSNTYGLQRPIGLKWTWGEPSEMRLVMERSETIESLKEKITILMQLQEFLKDGPKSIDMLAHATGLKRPTLTSTLSRGKRSKQVVLLPDGRWALGVRPDVLEGPGQK